MPNLTIAIPPDFEVTHEQFKELASVNYDIRLERTTRELILIPPTGSDTGYHNLDIEGQL